MKIQNETNRETAEHAILELDIRSLTPEECAELLAFAKAMIERDKKAIKDK